MDFMSDQILLRHKAAHAHRHDTYMRFSPAIDARKSHLTDDDGEQR